MMAGKIALLSLRRNLMAFRLFRMIFCRPIMASSSLESIRLHPSLLFRLSHRIFRLSTIFGRTQMHLARISHSRHHTIILILIRLERPQISSIHLLLHMGHIALQLQILL